MTKSLSRRDFLKIGGAAAATLAAGSFIPPQVASAAREAGLIDANGDGYISTMCEMCVWRCGVLAKVKDGKVVNAGGRVLGVTARGRSIREAIQNAYAAAGKIHWKDCFYRRDIGHRALSRECNK